VENGGHAGDADRCHAPAPTVGNLGDEIMGSQQSQTPIQPGAAPLAFGAVVCRRPAQITGHGGGTKAAQ